MVAPTRWLCSTSMSLRFVIVTLPFLIPYCAAAFVAGAARIVGFSINDNVPRFSLEDTFPTRVIVEVIHQSSTWCVAKPDASQSQLQDALDWACGIGTNLGNADCSAIQSGATCYNPNTVAAHASYAFNEYFQQENRQSGSCYFGGVAQITTQDPSSGTCVYPASSTSSFSPNISSTNPTFGTGPENSNAPATDIHFRVSVLCLPLVMMMI